MDVPLELSFRQVQKTEQLEALIQERAAKLEKFHPRIVSCRIAVEKPQEHPRSGNPYRVRIEVRVPPSHDLVVDKRPQDHAMHDPLDIVLNDTFKSMERQLKELAERQNMEVKHHDVPIAFVIRLLID